ncbi:transposable element Tcb2 transposase [Trichonephila clavipes]|nr:transposable element Tcb2 transposase [Trichonephila clavipes]
MPSCHSVHDLELAVQDLWAHLPQDNIRCLINSMPDRVAACIAAGVKSEIITANVFIGTMSVWRNGSRRIGKLQCWLTTVEHPVTVGSSSEMLPTFIKSSRPKEFKSKAD